MRRVLQLMADKNNTRLALTDIENLVSRTNLKNWDKLELRDEIIQLVFHPELSDSQKIISLQMLLEGKSAIDI